MALCCPIASLPAFTFTRLPHRSRILVKSSCNVVVHGRVRCMAASTEIPQQTIVRRSANYHPSIWGYDYIQSLSSNYVGESFVKRVENLKEDVRLMLATVVDPLHQLELIDNLQRLGVSYHFQDEILGILTRIYNNKQKQQSLYGVALEFRLLRQHGFDIPADIFNKFREGKGNFKSYMNDDCMGILYLYEAAFLLKEGENMIFHDIRNFTTSYLKAYMAKQNKDEYLSTLVNHALELPLHWRMPRLETRWFIDVYESSYDMCPILIELAKLDFNIVQATHQEDLKYSSRWWRKTGLVEKLSFARDRLVENFFWNVGLAFEPQFGYCRRMSTKVNALITTIDDVYDVYGSLDELELFTDAVDRWDVSAMEQLPEYMKICFLALFNSVNEMGFDALKEHRVDIISYVKKAWADMCKAYLLEAKWYYSGYKPTLEEYIENAWLSIAAPVILVHAYFSITNPITSKDMECLEEYRTLVRCSAINLRLADDLGTSSDELKRGDVLKSIQCHMHETGASEEDAREHIRELIAITWMKMNKEQVENPQFSKAFIGLAMNLSRMAQCIYQYGDGHGIEDQETKDRILSLFVNPIPL